MTWLADEGSVEASEPREVIEFIIRNETYRLATGTRDIVIDGYTYTASPSQRGEIQLATSAVDAEIQVSLPMSHPLAQRWLALGSPPRSVVVNVYRQQPESGEARRVWTGYATELTSAGNGSIAVFKVPSRAAALLRRSLPIVTTSRGCAHRLYDQNCQVDRNDFLVETTITAIDGQKITVASVDGNPSGWATGGELVHVLTGERMTIWTHSALVMTIQAPISGMQVGQAVEVYAGCDLLFETCKAKFDNRNNFVGFPQMNTERIISLFGLGITKEL